MVLAGVRHRVVRSAGVSAGARAMKDFLHRELQVGDWVAHFAGGRAKRPGLFRIVEVLDGEVIARACRDDGTPLSYTSTFYAEHRLAILNSRLLPMGSE